MCWGRRTASLECGGKLASESGLAPQIASRLLFARDIAAINANNKTGIKAGNKFGKKRKVLSDVRFGPDKIQTRNVSINNCAR